MYVSICIPKPVVIMMRSIKLNDKQK